MIVLDTDVVSELMKASPDPSVLAWIDGLPGTTVFVSAITQAEILHGIALVPDGKRRHRLEQAAHTAFETYFRGPIPPFDPEAADASAPLAASLGVLAWRKSVIARGPAYRLFEHLRTVTIYVVLESWDHLLRSIEAAAVRAS